MAKKNNNKVIEKIKEEVIVEISKEEPKAPERVEFPISFAEYVEDVDNYLSRALKIYANIDNVLIVKTRSEWDFLLLQLKTIPIV